MIWNKAGNVRLLNREGHQRNLCRCRKAIRATYSECMSVALKETIFGGKNL